MKITDRLPSPPPQQLMQLEVFLPDIEETDSILVDMCRDTTNLLIKTSKGNRYTIPSDGLTVTAILARLLYLEDYTQQYPNLVFALTNVRYYGISSNYFTSLATNAFMETLVVDIPPTQGDIRVA
jgi:hypothetical protein